MRRTTTLCPKDYSLSGFQIWKLISVQGAFEPSSEADDVNSAPTENSRGVSVAAKKKDGRETGEIEKEEAQLTRVIISVLRAARDDSDVTQEELGRRMGWSKKQMWDLEHGRKTVTVAHFFMIARRLGIDPERLVRRVKNY